MPLKAEFFNIAFKKALFFAFILPIVCQSQYKGTGFVTKGLAKTTRSNLYNCTGGRTCNIGEIKSTDSSLWVVPASVNFTNAQVPFASDLHNVCIGKTYSNSQAAINALDGSDIINIDSSGELITGYIFADNYFECFINGIPVGKDKVPFTQFNSSIVRFRVKRPFVIAMQLVDWEERLGLGAELNGGFAYHPGDGGMVAVFTDTFNSIVAKTDSNWKAQTFYTAPIKDLTCPTESGSLRLSNNCNTADEQDGSQFYGLHWNKPSDWMAKNFDDSKWPSASLFSNATVGVNNKPAYTNFSSIFDNTAADAQFIWSTNLILDNEVVVRYKVNATATSIQENILQPQIDIFPNPGNGSIGIKASTIIQNLAIFDELGQLIQTSTIEGNEYMIHQLEIGVYTLKIITSESTITKKIIVQ